MSWPICGGSAVSWLLARTNFARAVSWPISGGSAVSWLLASSNFVRAVSWPISGGSAVSWLRVRSNFVRAVSWPTSGGSAGADDCSGSYDYHFTQANMLSAGFSVGTQVYAQYWYRDTAHVDGTGVGFSDAVEFQICP